MSAAMRAPSIEQRPRAAHGVEQRAALRGDAGHPARSEDGRRQVLLERSVASLQPVAAPVQAFSGQVQAHDGLRRRQMDGDAYVRADQFHSGPPARLGSEPIDDRVLDPLLHEVSVDSRQRTLADGRGGFDRQGAVDLEMVLPGHAVHGFVELVEGRMGNDAEPQQHPAGDPRPETGAIGQRQRAGEDGPGPGLRGVGGAQSAEFVDQQALGVPGTGGEETLGGGSSWFVGEGMMNESIDGRRGDQTPRLPVQSADGAVDRPAQRGGSDVRGRQLRRAVRTAVGRQRDAGDAVRAILGGDFDHGFLCLHVRLDDKEQDQGHDDEHDDRVDEDAVVDGDGPGLFRLGYRVVRAHRVAFLDDGEQAGEVQTAEGVDRRPA